MEPNHVKPPSLGGWAYGPSSRSTPTQMRELKKGSGGHTTASAMQALLTAIEPPKGEKEAAAAQQKSVRTKLEDLLAVIDTFLSGSYRRHTQRRPCDDIDLLVVLDSEEYLDLGLASELTPELASKCVDIVFRALRKAYPLTEIVRFNRGVQIKFSGSGITFDVVPAFRFSDDEFHIPDTDLSAGRSGWLKTNPKEQERLMAAANQDRCGQMLVPLVKLLKAWAAAQGKPGNISGFHLEVMAYHALQHTPESYAHGLLFLFTELAWRVYGTSPDIWPGGEPAGRDMTSADRVVASTAFSAAAAAAERAILADEEGRADDAHKEWYSLFGDAYPETGEPRRAPSVLSGPSALQSIRSGAKVAATSAGLVAPAPGYNPVRSGTSHGGRADAVVLEPRRSAEEDAENSTNTQIEHDIEMACAQFSALNRLTPEEAATDPALWPVTARNSSELYALVGEQHTNLGRTHRILVAIPVNAPASEPRIFLLDEHRPARPSRKGWVPRRARRHRWADGALCTHAMRDRWDGRLVTLLTWAADYLVRHDYYEMTGQWIGREIDAHGHFRMNGRQPTTIRRR